jgi:hypothetical protein
MENVREKARKRAIADELGSRKSYLIESDGAQGFLLSFCVCVFLLFLVKSSNSE